MYTHMHTRTHAHIQSHSIVITYTHTHTRTHTRTHAHTHTHRLQHNVSHTLVHTYNDIINTDTHTVHTRTHIYTRTHIRTHTYTHTRAQISTNPCNLCILRFMVYFFFHSFFLQEEAIKRALNSEVYDLNADKTLQKDYFTPEEMQQFTIPKARKKKKKSV